MADSSIAITAGSGTPVDTRTQADGDHRQVMVIGDPDNATVARVTGSGLAINGGTLLSTSGTIASGTTGTIGPLDVAVAGNVTFTVRNTTAGTPWGNSTASPPVLVFEQSDDGTSWSPLPVVRNDTGFVGATQVLNPQGVANMALVFECAVEAVAWVRCRVTTGPGGTAGFTVVITAGGMPFPQGNTLLTHPLDGNRLTYMSSTTATVTPHLTATQGVPFVGLRMPSGTFRLARLLRLRVELTIATAALVHMQLYKSSLNTGGSTLTAATVDFQDPGASANPIHWTTAPAAVTAGYTSFAHRRLWVGVATGAGAPYVVEFTFGTRPAKAPIIRPENQVCLQWLTAPGTAITANYEWEWTEEPL